jgi:hypothetical protein
VNKIAMRDFQIGIQFMARFIKHNNVFVTLHYNFIFAICIFHK